MKDTTKTIIIGVSITIIVLILTIFIIYKIDSKKVHSENNTNREEYNDSIPTVNTPDDTSTSNDSNDDSSSEPTPTINDKEKNSKIILYMFHGNTCPHCINAIKTIKEERNTTFKNVEIRTFEVYKNKDNSALYEKVNEKLKVNVNSIPYFIIGTYNKVGFKTDDLLKEYKNALNNKSYQDIVAEVIKENPNLNPVYETI